MPLLQKKAHGFSLVELVVTLAVVTIVGLITAQVITDVSHSSSNRQLTVTRDQVAIWVRASAGNLTGILNSLKRPENGAFYKCVCGGGCTSAVPGGFPGSPAPPNAFTLYDITKDPTTGIPNTIPIYYTGAGVPCASPTAGNCLINVSVNFIAQCPPVLPGSFPYPPYTCPGPAEFIGIMFTVQQNPSTLQSQGSLLKPIKELVFTQVSLINPTGSGVCP